MGGLHAGADAFNEMASGFNVNAGALVVHLLRLLPLIPSSRKACPIRLADQVIAVADRTRVIFLGFVCVASELGGDSIF